MDRLLFSTAPLSPPSARELLARCNRVSEPFGLALTENALAELLRRQRESLREAGRVEFGEGALAKLVSAFCDSPYLSASDYAETLGELLELFYLFKSECRELLSDDELTGAMRLLFDGVSHGSTEYLAGVDWETMVRIGRTGSLEGTGLLRPLTGEEEPDDE